MSISYLFFISSTSNSTPRSTPSPPAAPPSPFEGLLIKSDNSSFHCSKSSNTCPHNHLYHDCHDHLHFISVINSFIILDIDIIILIIASINHHALYEE